MSLETSEIELLLLHHLLLRYLEGTTSQTLTQTKAASHMVEPQVIRREHGYWEGIERNVRGLLSYPGCRALGPLCCCPLVAGSGVGVALCLHPGSGRWGRVRYDACTDHSDRKG